MMSIILIPIIIVVIAISGVVFGVGAIIRKRKKKGSITKEKDWYKRLALSKEDGVRQFFFLLAVLFLGISLLALNKDLGELISWRMILLITIIISFAITYYFKCIYTLIFSLISFPFWWGFQAANWMGKSNILPSALIAGLALIALIYFTLSRLYEKEVKFKRFALIHFIIGIITITGILFLLSTKPGLSVLAGDAREKNILSSWALASMVLFFTVSLSLALVYTLKNKLISSYEVLAVGFLALTFFVIALLPQQKVFIQSGMYSGYFGNRLSANGTLWAIFFNIIVFFQLLGIIFLGYMRKEEWIINLGALFLFLLILVKYFDWFFTFIDKGIFFIITGIIVMSIGWFMERGRRYIVSSIKIENGAIN